MIQTQTGHLDKAAAIYSDAMLCSEQGPRRGLCLCLVISMQVHGSFCPR